MRKIDVTFCSEWEEGLIESTAKLDVDTGLVSDIAGCEVGDEFNALIREFVIIPVPILGDFEAAVKCDDDNEFYISQPDLMLVKSYINPTAPTQSGNTNAVTITSDVSESDRLSGFQNATLQSAGGDFSMSIATRLDIPVRLADADKETISAYVSHVLGVAANAVNQLTGENALTFEVQIGPSMDDMGSAPRG